jgi:hypothetical protein
MARLPLLNADTAMGPALGVYAAAGPVGGTGAVAGPDITPMGLFDSLGGLGDLLGGVLGKLPCLLECGIPNAVSIASTCGFDPTCWISQGPQAGLGCISKCLGS